MRMVIRFFNKACAHLKKKQTYKVWQDGYHAEICSSNTFKTKIILYT